jgi:hypothetical protein
MAARKPEILLDIDGFCQSPLVSFKSRSRAARAFACRKAEGHRGEAFSGAFSCSLNRSAVRIDHVADPTPP